MAWKWKRRTARKSGEGKRREQTERVAYLVYRNRMVTGKAGDAKSDWEKAEKIVQTARSRSFISFWKSLLNWANTPRAGVQSKQPRERIIRRLADWWETTPVEKTLEDVEHILSNSALLSLLGLIGNVGIIIAVVTYIGSEEQRRDAEILNAWQTITSAAGLSGNGGRFRALEFLNASPGANWRRKFPWFCAPHPLCTWPPEGLVGINLAGDHEESGAFLAGINLQGAALMFANLQGAGLRNANLQGAYLLGANLQRAGLLEANLQGAYLEEANLEGAYLWEANLWEANLEGAKNLTEEQVTQAKLCRTTLPDDIALDPNRDCEELGIDPEAAEFLPQE